MAGHRPVRGALLGPALALRDRHPRLLTALEGRSRRPLPSGLGAPADDHRAPVAGRETAVPWLQPAPDALLGGAVAGDAAAGDPALVVAERAGVRLAFIAALQHLPARQRAVLVLRDVLAFRTAEVAEILGTSDDAVDSALRRARAHLARVAPAADDQPEPDGPARRALLDGYVRAFTRADPDALVALLRADVEMEMPPTPTWFTGRDAVVGFLAARVLRPGRWRMRLVGANGQPAFLVHHLTGPADLDGVGAEPYGVQVLGVTGGLITRITAFNDPALVPVFATGAGVS